MWADTITAGAYTVEMTRGQRKDHWHVHLHAICLGGYLPQNELSRAWGKASNGSTIVHITRVRGDSRSISYTAAYAAKGYDADCLGQENWIVELIADLRGRRLLGTFGDWRGRQLERDSDDRTDWRPCGSLDSICHRAARGDVSAIGLLHTLNVTTRWDSGEIKFTTKKRNGSPPGELHCNRITGDEASAGFQD